MTRAPEDEIAKRLAVEYGFAFSVARMVYLQVADERKAAEVLRVCREQNLSVGTLLDFLRAVETPASIPAPGRPSGEHPGG